MCVQLLAWHVENDNDDKLLHKIKAMRQHFGVKFMDVVLASLALSIENYFVSKRQTVPERLTIVIPVRMEAERNRHSRNCV